jgi:predicted nuclease of predicted toxin-antitoxin system
MDQFRFLTDEDFDNRILRGLIRRLPELDVVRVQDVGLGGVHDEVILSWAAGEQRILLTHDLKTIPHFARKRISEGKSMAGVIWLAQSTPIGLAIEDILTIVEATEPEEWENWIEYLPL